MDHEHIIGLYGCNADIELETLKSMSERVCYDPDSGRRWVMMEYLVERFDYCPKCGEKLGWEEIERMLIHE